MKNKGLLLSILVILSGAFVSCTAQTSDQKQAKDGNSVDKVEVYYFHFERRCATCLAVEDESKKALEELYPEKMKSGEMIFLSVNIEDETNQPLAEQYEVSGQTLLIVKGTKQENLTNTAFMYAKTNPDKLKKAIGEAIEKL